MILHMAFVAIVWWTSDRNELNAQLLVAVRKDVGKEEILRKHSIGKRHLAKRASSRSIVKSRKKKFKILDNNAIEVWKLGDGELRMSDLDYLASDKEKSSSFQMA